MARITDPFPDQPTKAFWKFVSELNPIFCVAGVGVDALENMEPTQENAFSKYGDGARWNLEAMLLSRAIDLFQTYLYSLLDVILSQRPETLPDKRISVREIF